jgi:hypothetical protein
MKYILAAVLVLILSCPLTANAIDNVTFTATTVAAQVRLNALSYTIINDGDNDFYWFCDAANESITVAEPCGTMNYDTTTGNATIRIFYIQEGR